MINTAIPQMHETVIGMVFICLQVSGRVVGRRLRIFRKRQWFEPRKWREVIGHRNRLISHANVMMCVKYHSACDLRQTPRMAMSLPGGRIVALHGSTGSVACRLFADGQCGVFDSNCAALAADAQTLDGLPGSWVLDTETYTTAELPCRHSCHVSVLALHFLVNDMRCPLCREGPGGTMHSSSLPADVRAAVLLRLQRVQGRSPSSSDDDDAVEVVIGAGVMREVEQHLRLVVEIQHCAPDNTRLMFYICGPVYVPALRDHYSGDRRAETCYSLTLQRTFVRHVLSRIRLLAGQAGASSLQFSLQHPLLERRVATRRFAPVPSGEYALLTDVDAPVGPVPMGHVGFDCEAGVVSAGISLECVLALCLETQARM